MGVCGQGLGRGEATAGWALAAPSESVCACVPPLEARGWKEASPPPAAGQPGSPQGSHRGPSGLGRLGLAWTQEAPPALLGWRGEGRGLRASGEAWGLVPRGGRQAAQPADQHRASCQGSQMGGL